MHEITNLTFYTRTAENLARKRQNEKMEVVILNWNWVVTLNWNWVVNITGICSVYGFAFFTTLNFKKYFLFIKIP